MNGAGPGDIELNRFYRWVLLIGILNGSTKLRYMRGGGTYILSCIYKRTSLSVCSLRVRTCL